MQLESAQLINNAIAPLGFSLTKNNGENYGLTHKSHPCSVWLCESRPNLIYGILYFESLINEYEARYKKPSSFRANLNYLHTCFNDIYEYGLKNPPKNFPVAINDFWLNQLVHDNIITKNQYNSLVESKKRANAEIAQKLYQAYLIYAKASYAEWRYSTPPAFWLENISNEQDLSVYGGKFSRLNYKKLVVV